MLREMKRRLESAFTEDQVAILAEVLDEQRTGLATSVDMQDLKDAVKRLAIAQARTEERLERVEVAIEKLTAAQARTEKRMDRLEERLERVEAAIEKLTAAQIQTGQTLNNLIGAHRETRRQLGGLSMTVGYTLENAAYRALPALLKADYGIEVQGQLIRTYIKDNRGRSLEVNIYGKGRENGREVVILGESKSQLSANNIDRFINRRLKPLRPQFENVLPVLITHMISSEPVAAYAKEHGIALYYSYQF